MLPEVIFINKKRGEGIHMNQEDLNAIRLVVREEIEGVENRFDNLESRFDNLENSFDNLENRFDNLENSFGKLENRFDVLQENVDILNTRFKDMEERQDEMNTRFMGMEERQNEMYNILKGIEEFKPLTRSKMDKLEVDMAKMKNHNHTLKLKTEKVEMVSEDSEEYEIDSKS